MISVVICTHNRSGSLARTLESLRSLEGVGPWEVIVVDNASTDDTAEVVREARGTLPLRYHFEPDPGLSKARNAGLQAAQGDRVAFLDDDVRVRGDWLKEVERAFQRHPVDCVGGPAILTAEIQRPSWWRQEYEGKAGHFHGGEAPREIREPGGGMVGIGANLSFRKEAVTSLGGFRTDLGRTPGSLLMGEEIDLVERIRAAGGSTLYWPHAVVFHHPEAHRFSKRYLRRWSRNYGEWEYLRERERWGEEVRILGVPRWRYRSLARDGAEWVTAALRGAGQERFFAELRVAAFQGYLRSARQRGREVEEAGVTVSLGSR